MEAVPFLDGNIHDLIDSRCLDFRQVVNRSLQMHSSLVRRLSQETELEGHQGCVNSIAWNSRGSLLISGSDDTRINVWSYSGRKLLHSIETGHCANIFCTKFIPETSDELVVSGAGDAEVRLFNLSQLNGRGPEDNAVPPSALYQCHSRRVKKLAVEVGNPNVVWSASEDGTLRQHDFREGTSCPPAGSAHQECRNVLLDLRSGEKKSLSKPPKKNFALKSCDISATRPHLLLVGGSDAFARLYDRRMLPPLTSCRKRTPPPPCVNYFCPMHLSDRGRTTLHITHVAFSPDGEEVLLSYSGEHVYLMNVNNAGGSAVQYTSRDASKIMSFTPTLNGLELQQPASRSFTSRLPKRRKATAMHEKCSKLTQIAQKSLEEGDFYHGVEACNEVLDGYGRDIGPILRHDCLCTRAALLLERKWKNEAHMAIRDCYNARKIDISSVRAHYYMSEALSQTCGKGRKIKGLFEANISPFEEQRWEKIWPNIKKLWNLLWQPNPSNPEVAAQLESIQKDLAAAESGKQGKANDGGPNSERVLSLRNILYRSEGNSEASQDGPRSEREDSDYVEELELDFETSVSSDEEQDIEPNILYESGNLRIHRRSDSSGDMEGANVCSGSPSSSSQNERLQYQPEAVIDMKQRYVGHCNVGTDIKQASFLGRKDYVTRKKHMLYECSTVKIGEYVTSGSDDGRWFIWEKRTGRLIKMLQGDEAVVNCIQCHPSDCVVATSGIDNTIKLWTPSASVPSIVSGGAAGPETGNISSVLATNQRRLSHNRETILYSRSEILEHFQMQNFGEGSSHLFECAQS